jgi:hypothetical protein
MSAIVIAAVLAVGLVVDQVVPGVHVAVGLGVAAGVVVAGRGGGLTAADLGLAGRPGSRACAGGRPRRRWSERPSPCRC